MKKKGKRSRERSLLVVRSPSKPTQLSWRAIWIRTDQSTCLRSRKRILVFKNKKIKMYLFFFFRVHPTWLLFFFFGEEKLFPSTSPKKIEEGRESLLISSPTHSDTHTVREGEMGKNLWIEENQKKKIILFFFWGFFSHQLQKLTTNEFFICLMRKLCFDKF